jgi:hypothetical protein
MVIRDPFRPRRQAVRALVARVRLAAGVEAPPAAQTGPPPAASLPTVLPLPCPRSIVLPDDAA